MEQKSTTVRTHEAVAARGSRGVRRALAVRRALGAAVLVAVAAGGLAACGHGSRATGGAHGSITLYSGQHPQTTQTLATAFEQKTGIRVQVRANDEDTFADQIETEGPKSPADVFYTENTPPLEALQDKGLLAPLDRSTLAQTPARYNSPQGDWVGVSARVSVLIYNPKLIRASQLPKTILQLAKPEYKGKLAVAAGESDFYSVVTSVDRAYGATRTLAWLKAIKKNAGSEHIYPDNETVSSEVNRGQAALGVINQYYWYRMRAEIGASRIHSKLAYFAPHDPGYVLDISGAGVLKSSKNKKAGQEFVAFLVSKQGQQIITHSLSYEYPLDHGVKQPAEPAFSSLEPNGVTVADLGNGSKAIALMRQAGLL
ncbi:MAG TPA: extracellular solute-binding protein [Acidimicrobiales bacterium]|nr:extracellular solute-binding protein [Acidimicrobiales bacterium]